MATFESGLPNVAKFFRTLRGNSYQFESAVADLIDNSISAGATEISIEADINADHVWVLDNGHGMTEQILGESMRLASETRSYEHGDLGKFGMGMKAASLSIAKRLTVASKAQEEGLISVRRLDYDHIQNENSWQRLMEVLDVNHLPPAVASWLQQNGGTAVLWENIDYFRTSFGQADLKSNVLSTLSDTSDHLALVFHRFLDGTYHQQVNISINKSEVAPWDPFCLNDSGGTEEVVRKELEAPNAKPVLFTGYVLPSEKEFSSTEAFRRAGLIRGWNDSQGFYVYRNGRLISHGGWHQLRKRDEHIKLARLRLDITDEHDEIFSVNVAKSAIKIPGSAKAFLKARVEQVSKKANERYRSKAPAPKPTDLKPPGKPTGKTPDGRPGGGVPPPVAKNLRAKELADLLQKLAQENGLKKELGQLQKALEREDPALAKTLGWYEA